MKGIVGCDLENSHDISKMARLGADFGITQESTFENEFFDELWIDNSTNKNIRDSQYTEFFRWLRDGGNLYIPFDNNIQGIYLREKPIITGFLKDTPKSYYNLQPLFTRQEIIQHNIDFLSSLLDKQYFFIVEFIEKKYPIVGYQGDSTYCPNGYYLCTKIRYA